MCEKDGVLTQVVAYHESFIAGQLFRIYGCPVCHEITATMFALTPQDRPDVFYPNETQFNAIFQFLCFKRAKGEKAIIPDELIKVKKP
jgi:hypothetical protein